MSKYFALSAIPCLVGGTRKMKMEFTFGKCEDHLHSHAVSSNRWWHFAGLNTCGQNKDPGLDEHLQGQQLNRRKEWLEIGQQVFQMTRVTSQWLGTRLAVLESSDPGMHNTADCVIHGALKAWLLRCESQESRSSRFRVASAAASRGEPEVDRVKGTRLTWAASVKPDAHFQMHQNPQH